MRNGRQESQLAKRMPYSNCYKYSEVNVFLNGQKQWPTNRVGGKEYAGPLSGTEGHAHEKRYIRCNLVNLIESRLNKEKPLGIWVRDHLGWLIWVVPLHGLGVLSAS